MLARYFTVVAVGLILVFALRAQAFTINRLNGGSTVIYIDFSLPGSAIPLELVRSYNSLTALNETNGWLGAFGWGWTSPFETTLTTTPERNVILRDGGSGNIILFRPPKEDPRARELFFDELKKAYFEAKLGRKLGRSELQRQTWPEKILRQLKSDPRYRAEMAEKYRVTVPVPQGELLTSTEYGYQTIQFKNNLFIREKDGVSQIFDKKGRLVRQVDKNGFQLEFKYSPTPPNSLVEISDKDRLMVLKFTFAKDRIVEVVDNRGQKAKYTYDDIGNLTGVVDSKGQNYLYRYENKKFPHLLTRIDYPGESTAKEKVFRELRYDDNGLVVFHREKDGTETNYLFGRSQSDPDNQFWTKSIIKRGGQTQEEYDEFYVKARADGGKYLYKQESKKSGETVLTIYNSCCGQPQQIIKNGAVTNYKYYDNGLLKERIGPKEDVRIEYDMRWKKVSRISQNGVISTYKYDDRGNLVIGENSKGQRVTLKYDRAGRILEMDDGAGQQISFRYNDRGRPVTIAEKGLGTIRIQYDGIGRITKTETLIVREKGRKPTDAKSQEVVRRIMTAFQNLLDIIRPAGVVLTPG